MSPLRPSTGSYGYQADATKLGGGQNSSKKRRERAIAKRASSLATPKRVIKRCSALGVILPRSVRYCTVMYTTGMDTWTVTEARAALSAILDRVKEGADVALTRHGEVVAVVSRPDRARLRRTFKLQAEATALRAEMEAARHLPLPSTVGDPAWADRMVAELRADRDAD